jgi:GNAT superfamily N-acetyltransferase
VGTTVRDLGTDDAAALAALMLRIEADHPTGFCLDAVEVAELMEHQLRGVFEGAFVGEALVAYSTIMPGLPREDGQHFILFGDVDPDRLGEGLGTLMLERSLDRARAIHARDAPHVPARYGATALAGREDQAALMTDAGLVAGRHNFLMVADLGCRVPAPGLPPDLGVTAFDPDTAEELRLAHNTAFADYPDGTPMGADFWTAFMVRATHNRHHLSVVARDRAGEVAGYVFAHEYAVAPSGGTAPEIHVPFVGTLPAHRGRGVATSLLGQVLDLARDAGYATASLNVDTANPTGALGIYERAGFRQAYRQDTYHLVE